MALKAEDCNNLPSVENSIAINKETVEPLQKDLFISLVQEEDRLIRLNGTAEVEATSLVEFTLEGRASDLSRQVPIVTIARGHSATHGAYAKVRHALATFGQPAFTINERGLIFHSANPLTQFQHPERLQANAELSVIDAISEALGRQVLIYALGHSQGGLTSIEAAKKRPEQFISVTLAGSVGLTGHDIVRVLGLLKVFTGTYAEAQTIPKAIAELSNLPKTFNKFLGALALVRDDISRLGRFVQNDVVGSLPRLDIDPSIGLVVEQAIQAANPVKTILEGLADNFSDLRADVTALRAQGVKMINTPFTQDGIFDISEVTANSARLFDVFEPFNSNHLGPQLYPDEFALHVMKSMGKRERQLEAV